MKKRRLRCDHDNNKSLFQNDDLHFYQIHNKNKKICDLLCDEIFLKFESLKTIISNKNSLFTNNF